MSASLATLTAGLPDYDYSQEAMPIMPDFNVTEFDVENLDRSTETNHNHDPTNQDPSAPLAQHTPQASNNAISNGDHDEALGNLLGALMSNQAQSNRDASGDGDATANDPTAVYVGQPANDLAQNDNQANSAASRLPSFDATSANDLFTNDDYSQFSQAINLPQTPIRQNTDLGDMAHMRRESLASQQSAPRRPATPQQREFAAFARLQFEDGSYYLNTYSCELGRDVLAYRAALQKEREEREAKMNRRHGRAQSSSGGASGNRRRQLGSQIQGSVVSEQGGFAGIDEPPIRSTSAQEKPISSQESESSVVKPAEYLINPQTMPSFDYHKSTELQANWSAQHENNGEPVDDEKPAAVTDEHLPNPNMCPLIPIHGKTKDGMTEAENHKKISRRHVKIQWNFERERWELVVQGRNGAFCDKTFVHWRGVVPLHDGSEIQIAHVSLRFRLPTSQQLQQKQQQPPEDMVETMEVDADEALPSVESRPSETPVKEERRESTVDHKAIPKILLKPPQRPDQQPTEPLLGPDGLPIVKRRGPGRPPKDGIMSTRERKEREKAAKMAQLREQNGGKTPPPSARSKVIVKPTPPAVEEAKPEVKPEKRKYTKRKATGEDGPEEDGEGERLGSEEERKNKKSRAQREKSESPVYPAKETLTAEQLARPPDSYAILLHKMLMEVYPTALPLKDIYRMMKMKWPWFVYEATTEGWQSSVRHNLNSEFGKLFDKGDKEGKGFAWKAMPEAQPTADKKRTTQAAVQRPRPPQQRPQFPPGPGQGVQWQQGGGTFPANGAPQQFINHGPWPPQGQSNAAWPQDGSPANIQQPNPQFSNGPAQQQQNPPQANQAGTPQPPPGQNQSAPPANNANSQAPPPPARQPPLPTSSSAASNMPCTIEGILAIKRFEEEMYNQLDEKTKSRDSWLPVFMSAKKRVLHGYPESILPTGETREEQTIMRHMQNFVNLYRNPNFKGFTITTRTPAPAEQEQTPAQATPPVEASRTVSPTSAPNGVTAAAQAISSVTETQAQVVSAPAPAPAGTTVESAPSDVVVNRQPAQATGEMEGGLRAGNPLKETSAGPDQGGQV